MRALVLLVLTALIQTPAAAADAEIRTAIQQAIAKLASQPNYSWTATTKIADASAEATQGPLLGQTQRDGYTYFKLALGENSMEAAFHRGNSAIKTDEGWQSSIELDGEREWIARRLNAFLAPTTEAAGLLAKIGRLRREKDGAYYADLKSDGAKELLSTRSRTDDVNGIRAKGWVRFWVVGGGLSRYEYNLEGKIPGPNRKTIGVNRTTAVEIKAIGTTRVEVPEDARKKLEGLY